MLIQADARHIPLADESVQTVVTSPPYWGLRDYGIAPSIWGGREDCGHEWGNELPGRKRDQQRLDELGERLGCGGGHKESNTNHGYQSSGSFCQYCSAWRGTIGLEPTPELYVQHIVEVFREVRRVLRKDGTCWVNLGDSYAGGGPHHGENNLGKSGTNKGSASGVDRMSVNGLKPKDLCGIPWRVAFALQADGWWLRSDIIWNKPNPMPESVTDRPTKSHEYIFLLAKSESYFYDSDAIKELLQESSIERWRNPNFGTHDKRNGDAAHPERQRSAMLRRELQEPAGRNKRSVWTVATQPSPDAHFATLPEDLIKPCILAGTSARGSCAECGASWERVVENQRLNCDVMTPKTKALQEAGYRGDAPGLHEPGWRKQEQPSSKTLGWQPTCQCGITETKPGIVLDPFVGSGTTVKVAQDLGRIGIGLDLKPAYLKMGRLRSAQQGLVLLGASRCATSY